MILHQPGEIRYFTFEIFDREGVNAFIFSRKGGISPFPWESLNVGGTVGDSPERVLENRNRAFSAVGRNIDSMFDVWQVHSNEVVRADHPRSPEMDYQKADIILTDKEPVTLFMRFADCVPILLFDPIHKVIGLVHAGWIGTVNQIGKVAVQAMHALYGTDPGCLLAGIGPSICVDHYPVGGEVTAKVESSFNKDSKELLRTINDQVHFDLWTSNKLVLEQAGIKNIELASICTVCQPDDWYSHRGEKGKTGRFGVLFSLKN
jgi:polyphenol oxidase